MVEANVLPAIRANLITKGLLPLQSLQGRLGALLYLALLAICVQLLQVQWPKRVVKAARAKERARATDFACKLRVLVQGGSWLVLPVVLTGGVWQMLRDPSGA